jgi:hypothetical protein
MNDDESQSQMAEFPDAPLPNRFTRGTLVGCLGILGVLALPLMLYLPFETWGLARWAILGLQLLAFCAVGGGIWLLAHVPSGKREHSSDPRRPRTARGRDPVLERPASWRNRLGMAALVAALVVGTGGFAFASFSATGQLAILLGMALVSVAGMALAVYGVCIAFGRAEPPAMLWVRTPATSNWLPQGGWVMLIGLTLLAWALLIAAEAQFAWGVVGLLVLLMATVVIAPAFRRLPPQGR